VIKLPAWLIRAWTATEPVRRWVMTVLRSVTGPGWAVVVLTVLAWVAAWKLGWVEAAVLAVFGLVTLVIAALFTIGRTHVEVTLTLSPERVRVGQSAIAGFEMTNTGTRRQASVSVRLPVGVSSAHYTAPALAPGETYDDWVTIPAARRGVVPVGPVTTYRSDPWSLVRREVGWTDVKELFIHPEVVPLDEIGTGLLRDLEGLSTLDVSNSDLAFHALRDYVPGDDQRYIHWKSSARLSAVAGEDRFMVRQFLDTRKSHLAVVSDLNAGHFASDDEFEVALSAAASLVVRTILDEMDLTVLCGNHVVLLPTGNYALDPYSRAAMGTTGLQQEFERVSRVAPGASLAVVVTGAGTDFADLQRGRATVPYNVRLLVIRVVLGAAITLRTTGGFAELTIGGLADLPRALRGGLS